MSSSATFSDFLAGFFGLFSQKTFRRVDYLAYLSQPDKNRSGDEASIVDTAIVRPLLGLLGFEPAERVYNQQRQEGRPDFAPTNAVYDTCFIVEDKGTSLTLTFDLTDPNSHLSQLAGYVHATAVRLGYLKRPQWQGKTWDEIKSKALIPEDVDALRALFASEVQKIHFITTLLDEIRHIDAAIDERVLDLYGITSAVDVVGMMVCAQRRGASLSTNHHANHINSSVATPVPYKSPASADPPAHSSPSNNC